MSPHDFGSPQIYGGEGEEEQEHSVRAHEVLIDILSKPINFSDIHVERDQPIMLCMPGGWVKVEDHDPFSEADIEAFLDSIDEDWRANINYAALSRAVDLMSCRLRVNAFLIGSKLSVAMNIRRQPLNPVALEDTGLPMFLRPMLDNPKGLILFTGPTGVGKTTSMAAMIDHINTHRNAHIITIEDPIEYIHSRKRSIISQKEVRVDTPTFSQGLRDALRQKPDVILVGEIRDRDTAETVFLASESGHLVLASMHTNSAKGAINKMLSWFPEDADQRARAMADSLICIVSQTLVPTLDGNDRVLATEVLVNGSEEISSCIEQPQNHSKLIDLMKAGKDKMSHTLNKSLFRLVNDRVISSAEAMRHTNDRLEFQSMLNK